MAIFLGSQLGQSRWRHVLTLLFALLSLGVSLAVFLHERGDSWPDWLKEEWGLAEHAPPVLRVGAEPPMPRRVLLPRELSDDALICADLGKEEARIGGGELVAWPWACRTVGEFRRWVAPPKEGGQ